MALNSQGRCEFCSGIVRNIPEKRLPIPALTELHNRTCPGIPKGKKQ